MIAGRIADGITALIVLAGIVAAITSPYTRGLVNSILGGGIGSLQAALGRSPTGFFAGAA